MSLQGRRPLVDVFVASAGILTLALVLGMWESLLALTLHFYFLKTPLYRAGACVGASHPHGGINNSNLMLSLKGVPKLTH
jgi:hypothetical protein